MDKDLRRIAKKIVDMIYNEKKARPEPYDTTATVRRVENGRAFVHIPGGVDETPVKLTINAEPGDNVQVRVAGGRAWIAGNESNPPTDDKTARKAQTTATKAGETAKAANTKAEDAQETADKIQQHFWTDEDGAHITEVSKEEYESDPENAGGNLLARGTGVEIKSGMNEYGNIPYVMNVGSNNIAIYADGSDLEDTRLLTITNVDESSEIKSVYSPILGTQDIGAITFGQYTEGLVLSYTRRSTGGQRSASLSIVPDGVSINKTLTLESDLVGPLITPTVSITATTGTLVSAEARRFGQVVQLWIQFRNTASIAAGANVFEGTLNTAGLRPVLSSTGAGFFGTHSLVGYLPTTGALVVRNASTTAITISSAQTASVSFTYLIA